MFQEPVIAPGTFDCSMVYYTDRKLKICILCGSIQSLLGRMNHTI